MDNSDNRGLMVVGLSAFVALPVVSAFGIGVLVGNRTHAVDAANAVGPVPPASGQSSTTFASASLSPDVLVGCEPAGSVPIICIAGWY